MNFFDLTKLFLIAVLLHSCSAKKDEKSLIKEINQEQELITVYKEALENLEKNDTFFAANKFLEAELLFPQSDWAPRAALMAAYSFYLQDYYSKSIYHLERFIDTYPKNKNLDYAYYLLAMCYYENIEDEKRDLRPLIKSKDLFKLVIDRFPESNFAIDAKFKINFINDILASKEIYIGRHYIKKEKWIAALNRFKNIIENYEDTIYVEEAIHRIVEIYYKLGLENEAKKYASILGYNYRSGSWYKETYTLFNQDYKVKDKKISKKDEKKGIINKFKKLFE
jgi:outer membrane protein assembly factor BamD